MVLYSCPRCGYKTIQKNDIRKHFARKRPCTVVINNVSIAQCKFVVLNIKPESTSQEVVVITKHVDVGIDEDEEEGDNTFAYICNKCHKIFKKIGNLENHSTQCVNIDKKDEIIKKQDTIIYNLQRQIELLIKTQGQTINNITYNTQIVINPFGKENTSYITRDYINGLIQRGPLNSIPKLLEYIHFNPEHRENHNIQIPNKKLKYAKIFTGDKWEVSDKQITLANMADKAYSVINNHYNGNNKYMKQFMDAFETKDKGVLTRISSDTEKIILTHQDDVPNVLL